MTRDSKYHQVDVMKCHDICMFIHTWHDYVVMAEFVLGTSRIWLSICLVCAEGLCCPTTCVLKDFVVRQVPDKSAH